VNISGLSTYRPQDHANVILLEIETDEGLIGLGETFFGAAAVETHLHEVVAPYLIGKDPTQLERHAKALKRHLGFRDSGVEMRAFSAVDIACWDLLGQASGQPLHNLLGGRTRDSVRTYNTCAGYDYVSSGSPKWGVTPEASDRPYEDLQAFLSDAGALALSLREQGWA